MYILDDYYCYISKLLSVILQIIGYNMHLVMNAGLIYSYVLKKQYPLL